MIFFLKIISKLSIKTIYLKSDFLHFLIYDLFSFLKLYRNKIVTINLKKSFPKKDKKWIKTTKRNFYSNFLDTLFEIIKLIEFKKSDIIKRVNILNPELITNEINSKKSIIILSSHYNNWEWLFCRISILAEKNIYAPYKPLSNIFFNKLLIGLRQKFGGTVIKMSTFSKFMIKNQNKGSIYFLLNDQVPLNTKNMQKYKFLGRKTAFYQSAEKLRKEKMPIFYAEMKKEKRGFYNIIFSEINKKEITKDYVSKLEKTIKTKPEYWLWSHNRWKR